MLLVDHCNPESRVGLTVSPQVPTRQVDTIPLETASTLAGVFAERIRRSPDALAYRQYDAIRDIWEAWTWAEAGRQAARWRIALRSEGLQPGNRVAIMLKNCREWHCFDLAAQSLGLVTVPLYTNDRPDNVLYILEHADVRLLLLGNADDWDNLKDALRDCASLRRILSLEQVSRDADVPRPVADWLPPESGKFEADPLNPDAMATIIYTSGTTGRPKGVMLSHRNMLWDIQGGLQCISVYPDDLFLSFLPLSHTLERTSGFYLPIVAGAGVAFSRSIPQLAEDLQLVKPTIIISVPRIFERVYGKLQDKITNGPAISRFLFQQAVNIGWRRFLHRQGRGPWSPDLALWPLFDKLVASKVKARLGGRLRFAVCGGAALSERIAQLFIGLDIPITQGYGLTEHSPVISVNPLQDNIPASVGTPFKGIDVRISEREELLVRSPSTMPGYWKDPDATAAAVDSEGWLHTGDKVRMEQGHLFITGRLKEIIVLANGEKVAPADIEMAIALDPLFEQVLVVGEGRPYLTAMIVPEAQAFADLLQQLDLPSDTDYDHPRVQEAVLDRVTMQLHDFPGYAKIFQVKLVREPWSVENGFMTPTMKLRRSRILTHHAEDVNQLYRGHI